MSYKQYGPRSCNIEMVLSPAVPTPYLLSNHYLPKPRREVSSFGNSSGSTVVGDESHACLQLKTWRMQYHAVAVATALPNLGTHVTWSGPSLGSFPVNIHLIIIIHPSYICLFLLGALWGSPLDIMIPYLQDTWVCFITCIQYIETRIWGWGQLLNWVSGTIEFPLKTVWNGKISGKNVG